MTTIKLIIEYILSFIFVILFMGFFINIVSVRIRYYFFKLIGKEKSIKYLEGESEDGVENNGSHGCFNYIIGFIVAILVFFLGLACLDYFKS